MALLWNDTTITGTANDDYILGRDPWGPSHLLFGGGGDDLIIADFGYWTFDYGTGPGGLAANLTGDTLPFSMRDDPLTAPDMSYSTVQWSLQDDPLVQNSQTVPHTTAYVEATGGEVWYSITTTAAQDLTIDLDFARTVSGARPNLLIEVWNTDGTVLLAESPPDSGTFSAPSVDMPYQGNLPLEWNTGGAGTYSIRIREKNADTISAGTTFLAHFSLTGQTATAPAAPVGNDTALGGDGDDVIVTGGGADSIDGGLGDDIIYGGAGDDVAYGGDGNDQVGGDTGSDLIYGGSGNDILLAGRFSFDATSVDTLFGGDGRDNLWSDGAADILYGGAGDDSLWVTGSGATTVTAALYAGDGDWDNLILYGDGSASIDIRGAHTEGFEYLMLWYTGGQPVSGHVLAAQMSGIRGIFSGGQTGFADGVTIDMDADTMLDLSMVRADRFGSEGGLVINGDDDAETISGAMTSDTILGRGGDDVLRGWSNNDTIEGGAGADTMYGGTGIDTLSYEHSTAGVDVSLQRGTGFGSDAEGDVFAGFEHIVGSAHNDRLSGADYIDGTTIFGGAGDDILDAAGTGQSTLGVLYGGDGDDTFRVTGTQYAAIYFGGNGGDTLDLSAVTGGLGYYVDASGTVSRISSFVWGEMTGIERVIGTEFDDDLTGSATVRTISGGAGDDTVTGSAGNDTLSGGAGADTLNGNSGIDTADYSTSSAGVSVALDGSFPATGGDATGDLLIDIENLVGSGFNDVLFGDAVANTIDGGAGSDILSGGAGSDVLYGGAGFDALSGTDGDADTLFGGGDLDVAYYFTATSSQVVDFTDRSNPSKNSGEHTLDTWDSIEGFYGANTHSNTIAGDAQDNMFLGGDMADLLYGGGGSDILMARGGDDVIYGGDGNDFISGDAGNDTLNGGLGQDTFYVFASSETDRIGDFSLADDSLLFYQTGATQWSDLTRTQVGNDVHVTLTGGTFTVIVENVQVVDLDTAASGFSFL